MTLREAIEQAHYRKGHAYGTTRQGAYWLATLRPGKAGNHPPCDQDYPEAITIRTWGGDGIGQSAADHIIYLELRHYRCGDVAAKLHHVAWHENGAWSGGGQSNYIPADAILEAETAEDVIVALKGMRYDDAPVFGDYHTEHLVEALAKLGLPESMPSPDEV